MTAMYHIANGETPPFDDIEVSEAVRDFVQKCCAVNPADRYIY